MTKITKAGVIGAGVMGSGIAAHLANAGIEVVLLDIEKKFADGGVARQLKANGFMDKSFAGRITTGSTGDDMGLLGGANPLIRQPIHPICVRQKDDIRRRSGSDLTRHRARTAVGHDQWRGERFCDLLQRAA